MESGYYPAGAEFDSNAPYNQSEPEEREIEVTVSLTISKTVKIKVSDYDVIEDYNSVDYDYSVCDLHKAVKEQIELPAEGWIVDDYEVILE